MHIPIPAAHFPQVIYQVHRYFGYVIMWPGRFFMGFDEIDRKRLESIGEYEPFVYRRTTQLRKCKSVEGRNNCFVPISYYFYDLFPDPCLGPLESHERYRCMIPSSFLCLYSTESVP